MGKMAAPESGRLVLSSRFVPLLSPVQITKQNHNKVKKYIPSTIFKIHWKTAQTWDWKSLWEFISEESLKLS